MDRSVVDYWIKTSDAHCFEYARRIIKSDGILCGGSAGANVYAAIKYAKKFKLGKGDRMVIIIPDCIRHYCHKFVNDNWMVEKGLYPWDSLHEPKHLLANTPISSLNLKKTYLLNAESTVGDVIEKLAKGATILPVEEPKG